jgi:hypothetical protein
MSAHPKKRAPRAREPVAGREEIVLDAIVDAPETQPASAHPAPSIDILIESAVALLKAGLEQRHREQAEQIARLTRERDAALDAVRLFEAQLDDAEATIKALTLATDEAERGITEHARVSEAAFELIDQIDTPGFSPLPTPLAPLREALRALPDPRAGRVLWSLD